MQELDLYELSSITYINIIMNVSHSVPARRILPSRAFRAAARAEFARRPISPPRKDPSPPEATDPSTQTKTAYDGARPLPADNYASPTFRPIIKKKKKEKIRNAISSGIVSDVPSRARRPPGAGQIKWADPDKLMAFEHCRRETRSSATEAELPVVTAIQQVHRPIFLLCAGLPERFASEVSDPQRNQ